jgi:DNA uptake protein ComE-like DNA-binding protein
MAFKTLQSFFEFSKQQRIGVFVLLLVIVALQLLYFFLDIPIPFTDSSEKEKWLSLQTQIDSLKQEAGKSDWKIQPFNPNYISDYKGYRLGMTVAEIDRLHDFRRQNKFVNSVKEFQAVTKVSDSLLDRISVYFRFPDWVHSTKKYVVINSRSKFKFAKKEEIEIIDINAATPTDLMKINGIGEVISLRILKYKESLGGFVSMEQLKEVWGLPPEVIDKLNTYFRIKSPPNLKKIDINNASIKELSLFPYFKYPISRNIVAFRSMNGDIKNTEDLTKINGLSIEKAKIIALYLDF